MNKLARAFLILDGSPLNLQLFICVYPSSLFEFSVLNETYMIKINKKEYKKNTKLDLKTKTKVDLKKKTKRNLKKKEETKFQKEKGNKREFTNENVNETIYNDE